MPDRQVRPGVNVPVWGNAGNAGAVGDGSANGEGYSWSIIPNPNVVITDDGDPTGTVGNDRFISEDFNFALINGSTREIVTATLDVGGATKSVDIDIVDPLDPISISDLDNLSVNTNISIEDGLRYLYLQQNANGFWPGRCSVTSFALWSMSNSGHAPTNNPNEDIYAEWVRLGLDALAGTESLSNTTAANADVAREATADGVSDVNSNGQSSFLCNGDGGTNYSHPIALAAFIAARDPDNYQRLVEDGIDYIGRSQNVSGQRGGWNYSGPSTRGDMSVDSWNYMAIEGADVTNYNIDAPDWISQESEFELISHQTNATGGRPFGYTSGNPLRGFDHGQATTCGGLSGLALVDAQNTVPVGDILDDEAAPLNSLAARRDSALDYIGQKWGITAGSTSLGFANRGNYYTMWTCCRALRLTEDATDQRVVLTNGGVDFDWETGEEDGSGTIAAPNTTREGYGSFLTRTQSGTGAWSNGTYLASAQMQTALALLCLNPTVFGTPDLVAPVCNVDIDAGALSATGSATDDDSGIFSVELVPGAVNLTLVVDPFVPGDLEVTFTLTPTNPAFPSIGEVEATDGGDNTCRSLVQLGEFDPFGGLTTTPMFGITLPIFPPSPTADGVRCTETDDQDCAVDLCDDPICRDMACADPECGEVCEPDFGGLPFTPFPDDGSQADVDLLLSDGEGTKIVCCEFLDESGDISPPICSTIEVVTNQPPEVMCLNPTVSADDMCLASTTCEEIAECDDPDGDPTTQTCGPEGPYGLGTTDVEVTCDDGADSGGASCQVTVVDDTPPTVFCSADLTAHDDSDSDSDSDEDDDLLQLTFGATDACGAVTVEAVIHTVQAPGGDDDSDSDSDSDSDDNHQPLLFSQTFDRSGNGQCSSILVVNGQFVEVECDDEACEIEFEDGIQEIEASGVSLVVTATDEAGNTATCEVDLCAVPTLMDDDVRKPGKRQARPRQK